jgi:formate dehydrogenase beta subunit
LIEFLHLIQDRHGCLADVLPVALAAELKMAMTEVYEVATFYHHFDVVKDGQPKPPAITVRVCHPIACELAGAHELLERLPGILGQDVRVLHAPCVGRSEMAPAAVVGHHPIPHATAQQVAQVVRRGHVTHPRAEDGRDYPSVNRGARRGRSLLSSGAAPAIPNAPGSCRLSLTA